MQVDTFNPHLTCTTASDDAFLKYSSDEVRMKTLKMSEGTSSCTKSSLEKQAIATPKQQRERKTRISFELHPSLIMEDMIFEDDLDNDVDGEDINLEDLLQDVQMR